MVCSNSPYAYTILKAMRDFLVYRRDGIPYNVPEQAATS